MEKIVNPFNIKRFGMFIFGQGYVYMVSIKSVGKSSARMGKCNDFIHTLGSLRVLLKCKK